MQTKAAEFADTWNLLGNTHQEMSETQRIETEERLFQLKRELQATDVAYIAEHVDQHRVIQQALLGFLS